MSSLSGKIAMVTGASRGLGKDIAVSLARAGAFTVATARTETDSDSNIPGSLERTVQLMKEAGGDGIAMRCDVAREEDIESVIAKIVDSYGKLDILVNNAGIQTPGTILSMQPRHFDLSYRINVRGPYMLCRAVLPQMVNIGKGHIVNISSGAAIGPGEGPYRGEFVQSGGGTTYGTSKAALERFTQGLAAEMYSSNISVTTLSPSKPEWTEGGHYFRTLVANSDPSYSGWRMSGELMGDAVVAICNKNPQEFTGKLLYDEDVLLADGMSEAELLEKYPVEQ